VIFLGELEEILEVINMVEFQRIKVPLFWQIGCCINSLHFQVAERALFFWNNDHIVNFIAPSSAASLSCFLFLSHCITYLVFILTNPKLKRLSTREDTS